jgi:Protein of unknown function (DUF3179)
LNRHRFAAAFLLLAAALPTACLTSGYRTKPRIALVDGDPVVQMAPPGTFRSATDPRRVSAAEHSDPPKGDARLLGLEIEGVVVGYPVGLLDRAEVIDDEAGGRAWVVTRCALTHVAAVYDRSVDGRTLTFENSGALWRDTLVLKDRETGTYWSSATGLGLSGPLAGKRLDPIPAAYTTATAWRSAFPESRYPDLGLPTSVPLSMRIYAASPWQGVSGQKTGDRRRPAKKELLSVAAGDEALAFTPEEVRWRGPVRATLGGRSISIEWDPRRQTVQAWTSPPEKRRELAVVPMYWFALVRHFAVVRTFPAPKRARGQ